jgi:hypothetical protein
MSQLKKGLKKRIMYLENKDGSIDGTNARIGYVTFSKTGKSIYYRGKTFKRIKGGGISGNYYEEDSGDEYWISGIKKKGSNVHWAESTSVTIDDDALSEYNTMKS